MPPKFMETLPFSDGSVSMNPTNNNSTPLRGVNFPKIYLGFRNADREGALNPGAAAAWGCPLP
jgi:hypothetical protein